MRRKDTDPLLSVVIPVYNVQDYLDRCMESVTQQTYRNLEIILVDDGSTDRSGLLCDCYASKDSRVKVIHKKNEGLVSTRKEGLRAAAGMYVTYVDADDWIEKEMFTDMVFFMSESDADLATSGCIRDYGAYGMPVKESIQPGIYENELLEEQLLSRIISTDEFFKSRIFVSACTKMYKKNFLMRWQYAVDNYINIGEDVMLMYYCLLNARSVMVTGKNYYHYCIRSNSITGSRKGDEWQRYQVLFGMLEKECSQHRNRVVNIMEQIKLHEFYLLFLQYADKIVHYKNNILFPFGEVRKEEKIMIYGAGKFGKRLKNILEKTYGFKVVAWIDKAGQAETQTVEALKFISFDKVIISVLLAELVYEIKNDLVLRGVEPHKILSANLELLKNRIKGDGEILQQL